MLDLDRYVPALITFIANKLSRGATVVYQKRFGVNVTEWRILSLLAIEPEISAARICHVIGFDKGPVSRTLAAMQERGLVAIKADQEDGRTYSISLTSKGCATHDQVIVVALERERRLLSVPEQGGTRSADRAAAARPRQSRCREGRRRGRPRMPERRRLQAAAATACRRIAVRALPALSRDRPAHPDIHSSLNGPGN